MCRMIGGLDVGKCIQASAGFTLNYNLTNTLIYQQACFPLPDNLMDLIWAIPTPSHHFPVILSIAKASEIYNSGSVTQRFKYSKIFLLPM